MPRMKTFLPLLLALIGLAGCASAPGPQEAAPPEWVEKVPADTGEMVYFVGYGSDQEGDLASAEDKAAASLTAEVVRYLGVQVSSETSAEARAGLDTFTADLSHQMKQTGSARIRGFRIMDRWFDRRDGRVVVYLLGEYGKNDLLREQQRLQTLFDEKLEIVAGPEREAQSLEAAGDYVGAVRKYLDAAAAALASDIENSDVKFLRTIRSARDLLSRISLVPLNNDLRTYLGTPFPEDFRLKVEYEDGAGVEGLSGVELQASFRELLSTGRLGIGNAVVRTGKDGIISFRHPVPKFTGTEKLTMNLNLWPHLEPMERVPEQLREEVDAFRRLLAGKKVEFSLTVATRAKDVPTGILLLDVDKIGNPTGTRDTASGLLEHLTASGFRVITIAVDPALLRNMTEAQLLTYVREQHGANVERLVFGTIGIEEFQEEQTTFLVKVSGTVKAADLRSGQILFSERSLIRARGSNPGSSISAAFRNLGVRIGERLVTGLP